MPATSARRSWLYVPGDSRRKIEKAAASDADVIILDLEDGIAAAGREQAMATIADSLRMLDFGKSERIVRLSAPASVGMERIYEEIAAIAPAQPDGWLLPKVGDEWEIVKVNQSLFASEAGLKLRAGHFGLHAMIENATSVVNLREICRAAARLQSLVFGAEDYAASIGAVRSSDGAEILYARSAIVAHAAAHGLHAVDCVYVHYQDAEGFAADCALARGLGFGGKTIIHPAQIAPCNEHFLPTETEIAWAQNVVTSFERQQDEGTGAFALNGAMIDRPMYRIAQQVLARAAVG